MSFISRGFHGRRDDADRDRVPPASTSRATSRCFSAGPTPHTPLRRLGRSRSSARSTSRASCWTWEESCAEPTRARLITVDIPTASRKWSKLDTGLGGRLRRHAARGVEHGAHTSLAFCDGGYTTNLPARRTSPAGRPGSRFGYDGEPLDPEHGGPARLLVPHLYFWKSAKWVRGARLLACRRARLLGDVRLPRSTETRGRSSGTRATERRRALTDGRRGRGSTETREREDARARRRGLAGPPRRPARRRPARPPRTATSAQRELLDRLRPGRRPVAHSPSSGSRTGEVLALADRGAEAQGDGPELRGPGSRALLS